MSTDRFPIRAASSAVCIAVAAWMPSSSLGARLVSARERSPQQSQQQSQQKPCPKGQSGSNNQNKSSGNNSSSGSSSGNGSSGSKNDPCAKQGNKPAPLFGGSLGIKTSHQSTDSTALGFNGVDPNGQVQQAFLNASPSDSALQKAQAMASYAPSAADLASFEHSGGLTVGPAQTHPN